MTAAAVIFTSVSCRYGRSTVVDTVQLGVAAGEHVALTGANGSGKTTLLRAALGLHPLAGGTVSVDGQSARSPADWVRRRREVAWVPQRLSTGRFPLLVDELLASAGPGADAARHAADRLGSFEHPGGSGIECRDGLVEDHHTRVEQDHLDRSACLAAGPTALVGVRFTTSGNFREPWRIGQRLLPAAGTSSAEKDGAGADGSPTKPEAPPPCRRAPADRARLRQRHVSHPTGVDVVESWKEQIVRGASIELPDGAFVGVIGPNGCGKTTLMRAIYRSLRPAAGTIDIGGQNPWAVPAREVPRSRSWRSPERAAGSPRRG